MRSVLSALTLCLMWPSLAVAQQVLPHGIPDFCFNSTDNVPAGQTVNLSGTKGCVGIFGNAVVTGDLSVSTIMVYAGGFLDVPSGVTITVRDVPLNLAADPQQFGTGILVFGRVRMLGTPKTGFVRLGADPVAGQQTLTLASSVTGWAVGDTLLLPDTRQREDAVTDVPWQIETRTIAGISGLTVTLSSPLTHNHTGARNQDGSSLVRAHVANLTRSIVIRSANPNGTRAHIVSTGNADVDIRYVRIEDTGRTRWQETATPLDQPGQPNMQGKYGGWHFHHQTGPPVVPSSGYQATFLGNVVVRGTKWGVTLHNTSFVLVRDNVVYDAGGAGIVTETGDEVQNVIENNLVVLTPGVKTDRGDQRGALADWAWEGSGIWLRGPDNIVRNNVVADTYGTGITYMMLGLGATVSVPTAPGSAARTNVNPRATALRQFANNEVYAALQGLTIWDLGAECCAQVFAEVTESTIRDTLVWHIWRKGYFGYGTNKVTFDGWTHYGDPVFLPNRHVGTTSLYFADYLTRNSIARRVTTKNIRTAIFAPSKVGDTRDPYGSAVGTFLIEDSTLQAVVGVFTEAMYGVTGGGSSLPPRLVTVRNTVFSHPTGALDDTPYYLYRNWRTDLTNQNLTVSDRLVFENLNNVAADDGEVYYLEQAAQNIAGGVAPGGTTTRSDIRGLVLGGSPGTPPPPPPPTQPGGPLARYDFGIVAGTTIPNQIAGVSAWPNLTIHGSDISVSSGSSTWNAAIGANAFTFPWNSSSGTYADTPATLSNSFSAGGTYGVRFTGKASTLAALTEGNMGLITFRPSPDGNVHTNPPRALEFDHPSGNPAVAMQLVAREGQNGIGFNNYFNDEVRATLPVAGADTTVIVTWNAKTLSIYLNGVLTSSTVRATPDAATSLYKLMVAVQPGLIHGNDKQFYEGSLRSLIVYDRVLNGSEIIDLHGVLGGTVTPPTPPSPEVCGDGVDNDGDLAIDEGCPPASIGVSPTSVSWAYVQGGAVPSPVVFTVTTNASVNWSTSESSGMFSMASNCIAPLTCATGGTTTMTPTAGFFATAAVGAHTAQLTVVAPGAPDRVVTVTLTVTAAPVVPPPVVNADAVVSVWSLSSFGAWSTCIASTQTRVEIWTRTVITPATGNGTTPALSETRTGQQACVVPVPTPPNVDAVVSAFALASFGPWSTCTNELQARSEIWTRTVITAASGTGVTPPLSEIRSSTRACVSTPPPPTTNPLCTSDPLTITSIEWPSARTGRRSGRWNSGTKQLLSVGFVWVPSLRLVATDVRGCTVTIIRSGSAAIETPSQNVALCASDPLGLTGVLWPPQRTGRRGLGRWDSGAKQLLDVGYVWAPSLRLVATDERGCTVTVVR